MSDNKLVVIGGILTSNTRQGSCFKLIGRPETLKTVKKIITRNLTRMGYSIQIEKGYMEE